MGYLFYALSVFSNASLAVAYCLIVRWGWKDGGRDTRLWRRTIFAGTPAGLALLFALIPLFNQAYNYK